MDNGGLDRTLFDTDAVLWKLQGALLPPKRDKQELTSVIVPRSKKPDMCPLGKTNLNQIEVIPLKFGVFLEWTEFPSSLDHCHVTYFFY